MRIARVLALVFTGLCLTAAVISLVMPTSNTVTTNESYSWTCGSPAFPKRSAEFDRMDDIINCTGDTPASTALTAVVLAGVGLGVVAFTSLRRERLRSTVDPDASWRVRLPGRAT